MINVFELGAPLPSHKPDLKWEKLHPLAEIEMIGFIPQFFSTTNELDARGQINLNYAHGGGWRPTKGFKLNTESSLVYPGDPPMRAMFKAQLRDETITIFESGWCVITQKDGTWEAARLD